MIIAMDSFALADMLRAARIVELCDMWTRDWHGDAASHAPPASPAKFLLQVEMERLHRANFDLWHQEDKARDAGAGDAGIAAAKRSIDRINQHRNDQTERCDALLLAELSRAGLPNAKAGLHSETPGMMLDRLSILSLKVYHTREEMERASAPNGHRERNRERLAILAMQREDLLDCLDRVWRLVLEGRLRFRLYRQLKMYNDPELNPVLYRGTGQ